MTGDPHAVAFNLLSEEFQLDPAATFADLPRALPGAPHHRARRALHARTWG